jgi:CelD/BcsL family acetyltransferase involved in cellulose biosynthesis
MDMLVWPKSDSPVRPHYHTVRPSIRTRSIGSRLAGTCLGGAQLSIFTSFQECESLWRTAIERCPCFAFQTFEWQSTWYATIGKAEGVRAYIVHVADKTGRTVLLLPLGIYPRKGLRFLCFLGGIVTDYNVPLIEPEFAGKINKTEFSLLWATVLDLLPRFDVVWLRRMPDTIERAKNPMIALPGAMHTENAHAAILPGTLAAFKAARRAKFFRDNRRRRCRLSEKGRIDVCVPVVLEEAIETLETMAHQKSRRYRETRVRDLFALPGYLQFYRVLTTTPFQKGSVHISCLRLDNQTLATHWGLIFNRRFYWLMPGYQGGDWGRYSVGRLLLENVVEWCISEQMSVFDLTVGDEGFKFDWADHSLPLYEYFAPRSVKGAVFTSARQLRARLRAGLKQSQHIRTSVRWLKARFEVCQIKWLP